jgi:anti-anti-sigma factor
MNDHPIKVLLVEDNPGDARLLREMLAEVGGISFELEYADQLSSGLERLAVEGIDLILLDLSLPDSQGLDTFARANAQAPQVPIIVLSGLDDEVLAVKAVREGAQDYLVKGLVDSNLLARAIRYAIERKKAEEALRKARDELERRVEARTVELSKANAMLKEQITERKQAEEERARLQQEIIEAQRLALRELSTPIVPVLEGVLVLPLVGGIDTRRAQQIMETLLEAIGQHQAEVVLIDITGVPVVDTGVAHHLLQVTRAAALLGAKCVLVGISPEVAQTIVALGLNLSGITTKADLQAGIEYALETTGKKIVPL